MNASWGAVVDSWFARAEAFLLGRSTYSLHEAGLVDEYRLLIFPVCVGTGKRLLAEDGPATGFGIVESRVLDDGISYLALEPAACGQGGLDVGDGKETVTEV